MDGTSMGKKHHITCACASCMAKYVAKKGRIVAATAGIAGALYASGASLPQQSATPLRDTAEIQVRGERNTRARGYRQKGGSGQQS